MKLYFDPENEFRLSEAMKVYITVKKSAAGYYVAEVPALPVSLGFGKTYSEALLSAKREIKTWVDTTSAPAKIDARILSHVLKKKGLTLEEFDQ